MTDRPEPTGTGQEKAAAPEAIDPVFLAHVTRATTSYTEGWRDVCARLQWVEKQLADHLRERERLIAERSEFERAWNDARAQRDEWQEKFDVAEVSLTTQAQTIQRVIERWNREADDLYHRVARLENPNGPSGNSMRTAALRLRLCAQQLSDLATSVVSERPEPGDRREG